MSDVAASFLAAHVVRLLDDARARKASFEQRAISLTSSAGVLVSLLVALSALVLNGADKTRLGEAPRVLIALAAILFVIAAALGIGVNAPRRYDGTSDEDLDRMVSVSMWEGAEKDAQLALTEKHIEDLRTYVRLNDFKGQMLQAAVAAEVAGIASVAGAIMVALLGG